MSASMVLPPKCPKLARSGGLEMSAFAPLWGLADIDERLPNCRRFMSTRPIAGDIYKAAIKENR
jgi:hypothetical protein